MPWFLILASKMADLCPDQYKNPLCKINISSCTGINISLLNFYVINFSATCLSWINMSTMFKALFMQIIKNDLNLIPDECFLGWYICQIVRWSQKVNFSKEISLLSTFQVWWKAYLGNNHFFGWWLYLLVLLS